LIDDATEEARAFPSDLLLIGAFYLYAQGKENSQWMVWQNSAPI
jgi:hypothetical protein